MPRTQHIASLAASLLACTAACAQRFQTEAFLIEKNHPPVRILLLEATRSSIFYQIPDSPGQIIQRERSTDISVFLCEPPEYAEALDLYQARKYIEAKSRFSAIRQSYLPVQALQDNFSTLAAFYEMECLRKLGDLEGLAAALQKFNKTPLTRENQLRQLDLYVLWDALRTGSWERLESLAAERLNERLPGEERAQVAYCRAMALEGLNRPAEALLYHQVTLTAGAGAAEVIAGKSALRILAIHQKDPEVIAALKARETPSSPPSPTGLAKLAEATAVAKWLVNPPRSGIPLPTEFQHFLK
jgi:hypothetical protein